MKTKTKKKLLPTYYTVAEYARLRGVTPKTIYKAIDAGRLITEKIGAAGQIMVDTTKNEDVVFKNENPQGNVIQLHQKGIHEKKKQPKVAK